MLDQTTAAGMKGEEEREMQRERERERQEESRHVVR